MDATITLNFDGGSRGNPGLAGIGIVLAADDSTPLVTLGKYIGSATNNAAEYMALIVGLREAAKLRHRKLIVRGDSELVIKQMRGEYRVKIPPSRTCTVKPRLLWLASSRQLRAQSSPSQFACRPPRQSRHGSQERCR